MSKKLCRANFCKKCITEDATQKILKGSIVMGVYKGATAKLMLLLKFVKVCVLILGSVSWPTLLK